MDWQEENMHPIDQCNLVAFCNRTHSGIGLRSDGRYLALIRLRGEYHCVGASAELDEARHLYRCGRMMLYGESWEQSGKALLRDEATVAEHRAKSSKPFSAIEKPVPEDKAGQLPARPAREDD